MENNERLSAEDLAVRRINRKKKKNRNKKIVISAIVLVILISAWNIFFGYDSVKSDKTVTIQDGSSTVEIAGILKNEGVISKKAKFIAEVMISGNYGKLKFGTFNFKQGMSYGEIVDLIVNQGAKDVYKRQ